MSVNSEYNTGFCNSQSAGSSSSASQIVPIVCKRVQPRSVVDLGCGIGTWLVEFKKNGVGDVMGFDGDYVKRSQLLIDTANIVSADLTRSIVQARTFDLAIRPYAGSKTPLKPMSDSLINFRRQLRKHGVGGNVTGIGFDYL
jgi:hypothetical protein